MVLLGRTGTGRGIAATTGAFTMAFEQDQDREDLSLAEASPPETERDSSSDRRPADALIQSFRARPLTPQEQPPAARRTGTVPPGQDQQPEHDQRGDVSPK